MKGLCPLTNRLSHLLTAGTTPDVYRCHHLRWEHDQNGEINLSEGFACCCCCDAHRVTDLVKFQFESVVVVVVVVVVCVCVCARDVTDVFEASIL